MFVQSVSLPYIPWILVFLSDLWSPECPPRPFVPGAQAPPSYQCSQFSHVILTVPADLSAPASLVNRDCQQNHESPGDK